jgi:hypothetical protein
MTRRKWFMALTTSAVALGLVVLPALADELIGRIVKVDVAGKKVVVLEKGTDKEINVTVTDTTEWITPKGSRIVDLEKIQQIAEKSKKGIAVEITHDKGVASKIKTAAKKKDGPR